MKQNNRKTGTQYEKAVGAYLESQGYQIVAYNYRCKRGEVDIIALDGGTLVFCEVKFRKTESMGHPTEAVDYRKQKRISKTALSYLTENHLQGTSCRFDVIGILGEKMIHIKNAFEYSS